MVFIVISLQAIENLQQFAFKPATNKNIKPIAGLRPATLLVAGLINISSALRRIYSLGFNLY